MVKKYFSVIALLFMLNCSACFAYELYDECFSCHQKRETTIIHHDLMPVYIPCASCHTATWDDVDKKYYHSAAIHKCLGCHGNKTDSGISGVGIRSYHTNKGAVDCSSCHGEGISLKENMLPPYYRAFGFDTCNGSEDLDGDGRGIDNDGDGLADGKDPDCQNAP